MVRRADQCGRLSVVVDEQRTDLARRSAALVCLGATVVFLTLSWTFVPWTWVPGGSLRPLDASTLFSTHEIARAEAYAAERRALGWAAYGVSLLVAAGLGFTGVGARASRRLTGQAKWWIASPLLVLLVLLIGRLVTLPFSLAIRRHNLEFGLTRQSLGGWAGDYVKGWAIEAAVAAALMLLLVAAARRSPRHWFAWVGGGVTTIVLAGSFLYPVVVEPVFNSFEPLPDGPLKQSVLRLADAQGVEVSEVLVADASRRTTTLNAYVSGLGGTRRVVIYDNAVSGLTPRQFRTILAHELAHARYQDVVVGTVLGATGAVLGVTLIALALDSRRIRRRTGVRGPTDPAAAPLVLALVAFGLLLASPVESAISRAIEARADRTALATTDDPDAFIETQRELARRALTDPTPPVWSQWWFGSHPTVLERAGLPQSIEAARG